ncbi:MAG TPA: ElyC/SanA/YdcF family protein [Syntrophales bacterium]|nr:ElyC/SanA/YdcF family protein [Syntrophales bacterium]
MDILFLLKKIAGNFLMPLSVIILFIAAGLLMLGRKKKRQKTGVFLIVLSTIILAAFSYGFIADALVAPLENRYPPLLTPENHVQARDIGYVVVLGGGSFPEGELPLSSRLTPESLARLLEGMRIYRRLPGAKLILSGGTVFQDVQPEAATLANVALMMGAREEDLIREDHSLDTSDQARMIAALIGKSPFILVTSAIHMPRSVALFRKQGLAPIPAPTNYLAVPQTHFHPGCFFPGAVSLRKTEAAIHEYLGLIVTYLK